MSQVSVGESIRHNFQVNDDGVKLSDGADEWVMNMKINYPTVNRQS